MSIPVALLNDTRIVQCDERTGGLGGSFYNNPHLQVYSPLPLRWCFDRLIIYPKATLLDIGASTGSFTLLSALHPDLTVHAFEPVKVTRRILNENIYLNELTQKCFTYPFAVSNYNGDGIMNVIKDDGGKGVSLLDGKPAWHKDTEPTPVQVVTIDSFCETWNVKPTFIKADTEGNEKAVLEGAEETIYKYQPYLLFEYQQVNADQYGYNIRDTIEMIESWGYTWVCPEGLDIWAVPKNWENKTE